MSSYTFSVLPLTPDTVGFPSYPPGTVQMAAGSGPDGGIVGTWWHTANATVDAGGGFDFAGVFPDTITTRPTLILTNPRPHYFVFNNPQAADSSDVPPPTTRAYGESDELGRSQIVGTYTDASQGLHGFIFAGGAFATVDDPLGVGTTQSFGINDAGQVVGIYGDTAGTHGFLYGNGAYTTLDDPLASGGTFAHGVNNHGQIVGYYLDGNSIAHGFVYNNGSYTTVDDPVASQGTYAQGINDAGSIAGYYLDSRGMAHGFVESRGTYTTLDNPDAQATYAESITDAGAIVGTTLDGSGASHGFVAQIPVGPPAAFDLTWKVLAAADFNGDGLADLAWQQQGSNLVEIQQTGATSLITGSASPASMGGGLILNSPFDATWSAVAAGDFNGDGRADLVWHRPSDSLTEIQFLNGNANAGGGEILNNSFGNGWDVAGAGDFNGDGKADLVWHRASDGLAEIQLLNGTSTIGGGIILNSPFGKDWNVASIGDFNGDGKSDLVWQRPSDGLVEIQLINAAAGPGGSVKSTGGGVIDNNPFGSDWSVVGAGDVNGDGKADLFWQRSSDGLVETQFLSGTTSLGGGISGSNPFAPQYRVAAAGDFNADGTTDLLYRDQTFTGSAEVRLLDGLSGVGAGTLNQP